MNRTEPPKKVIIHSGSLYAVGGAERLHLEEARYSENSGFETHVLTFLFDKKVLFNGTFKLNIEQIGQMSYTKSFILRTIHRANKILALRKRIKEIDPDIILLGGINDCLAFYFATLFTRYRYSTHIHGTIFWFPDDLLKYAFIYRKVFNEIRESVAGHKQFIPVKMPRVSLIRRLMNEIKAIAVYFAVRKASKILVLSKQMGWEVGKLYGKEAFVTKGAISREFLDYKPTQDVKGNLGIGDKKMLLNVNRLDPRKRVDLLIRAFKKLCEQRTDIILIIGGTGEDEQRLRTLVKELNLTDKVRFEGYISEEDLWDYLAACDVFVHPNWADHALAAYEPLALQKKVVWSTEMEIDEHLTGNQHVFPANPTVDDFANAIEKALITDVSTKDDLSYYTWDNYSQRVFTEILGTN